MMSLEEAREFFALDRYATETTGVVIEEVEEDYARCSVEIDERHLGAHGQIMGGVIFTLCDFTFAVATNTKEHFTSTIASNINFLSMAKDHKLQAICSKVKNGKRTVYYETKVTDGLGNLVAVATMTGMHMN